MGNAWHQPLRTVRARAWIFSLAALFDLALCVAHAMQGDGKLAAVYGVAAAVFAALLVDALVRGRRAGSR